MVTWLSGRNTKAHISELQLPMSIQFPRCIWLKICVSVSDKAQDVALWPLVLVLANVSLLSFSGHLGIILRESVKTVFNINWSLPSREPWHWQLDGEKDFPTEVVSSSWLLMLEPKTVFWFASELAINLISTYKHCETLKFTLVQKYYIHLLKLIQIVIEILRRVTETPRVAASEQDP